jgi:hypothetical protein
MRHHLPTSTFRKELEELKQHNGRLQRLITNCTAPGFPAQGKQPQSPRRVSPDSLRENTAQAKDIYHAICSSYSCQCPYPHEANLGLRQVPLQPPDDLEPFELIFPVDEEKKDMAEVVLQSPATYSSMASTEMALTEESYGSFGVGYDFLPTIGGTTVLTCNTAIRSFGHQETASEAFQHPLPENRKAVRHPHAIEEAAPFRLAGATMALKTLVVSKISASSSKAWTTIKPRLLRHHA